MSLSHVMQGIGDYAAPEYKTQQASTYREVCCEARAEAPLRSPHEPAVPLPKIGKRVSKVDQIPMIKAPYIGRRSPQGSFDGRRLTDRANGFACETQSMFFTDSLGGGGAC